MLASRSASGRLRRPMSASWIIPPPLVLTGIDMRMVARTSVLMGWMIKALRLPVGREFIFLPTPTKGVPHSKWAGVSEVGVLAGYRMKPGYVWSGEYSRWPFYGGGRD